RQLQFARLQDRLPLAVAARGAGSGRLPAHAQGLSHPPSMPRNGAGCSRAVFSFVRQASLPSSATGTIREERANRSLRLINHARRRAKANAPNQGAVMRRLFVAVALIASTCGASAQEFELPTLRGSDRFVPAAPVIYSRWDGFYAGAQVGYGFAQLDFATATRDLVQHELRELALASTGQV